MEKLITITTLAELKELEAYLVGKNFVAYDTETTGVTKDSEIIGFSICADVDVGYYVVLSYWDVNAKELVYLETLDYAKQFIEGLKAKQLILHNAMFDCWLTDSYFNVDLMPFVHTDTMLLGHLLNENRSNGLKELGVAIFGEDSRKEQLEVKESVHRNGGVLTKANYELYKADMDVMAKYGAKDAILTLKLFYHMVPELYEQGLATFFYQDETMPLLRGPTYDMNTTGLRIDPDRLQKLKSELEVECSEARAFIYDEIKDIVKEKYKGTGKTNTFNIGASKQLAWLLFIKLQNDFNTLTKSGKEVCKFLGLPLPYAPGAKLLFIRECEANKGREYAEAAYNPKTGKMSRPKKIGDPWNYLACGKDSLKKLAPRYKWVERFLEYAKNMKLLSTYVEGIQSRMQYNVIRPNFLQHGTTSGRYSCKNPNFQNLPRDDKRVKACIIARQGKVFVGADYSQLEPRVFASFSQDLRLMKCFENGDDFYSVVGVQVYNKTDVSLKKDDPNSFAKVYPKLRDITKVISLSSVYGNTAFKMSRDLDKSTEEAQQIIDDYFTNFPSVHQFMLDSHEEAKEHGVVYNLFGRPRRMPQAKEIKTLFGNTPHSELDYNWRNILNLACNHKVQSTGASIMNRAAIKVHDMVSRMKEADPTWNEVKIILQVHDELVLEGPEQLDEEMSYILKEAMENTTILPGVKLLAEPKIAYDIASLK